MIQSSAFLRLIFIQLKSKMFYIGAYMIFSCNKYTRLKINSAFLFFLKIKTIYFVCLLFYVSQKSILLMRLNGILCTIGSIMRHKHSNDALLWDAYCVR